MDESLRLNDAGEIIGNLILVEILRIETQIHRREFGVLGLDFDHWSLCLGRQVVSNLGDFGLDLRQGRIGVKVQPQMSRDRAQALRARRLNVVDAVRAGDDSLERRGDVAANKIGVRSDVNGLDGHHGDITARILPDVQRLDGDQPGDEDQQVDDHREHGPLDEEVGNLHEKRTLLSSSGRSTDSWRSPP